MSRRSVRGCSPLRAATLAATWVLLAILGCAPETRGPHAAWADSVGWLRSSADVHLQDGDVAAAALDLKRALALPAPATPEALQLLQDVDFALGSIELLQGRPVDAEATARRGIARSNEPTVFLANLHALRGFALEALRRPLDAAEAYHAALLIHERLFKDTLATAKASETQR